MNAAPKPPAGAPRPAGHRMLIVYALVGALFGAFALHPATMVIYWFEFNPDTQGAQGILEAIAHRSWHAFSGPMLRMAFVMAAIGSAAGVALGLSAQALIRRGRMVEQLRAELREQIASLIAAGESERVELKSSARWDYINNRSDRAIEDAITRTIAGFLNHRGGNLLIGVADDGEILGLEADYHTLRDKNRDGFERFIMGLVKNQLGGDLCLHLHPIFHEVQGKEVCRVVIEAARRPVYLRRGNAAHFYVRTGNATRELDVEEAVEHIAVRFPSG